VQQIKCFPVCRERQNGLFHTCQKIYASKTTAFDAALEAPSQRSMNGYVSENSVFLF